MSDTFDSTLPNSAQNTKDQGREQKPLLRVMQNRIEASTKKWEIPFKDIKRLRDSIHDDSAIMWQTRAGDDAGRKKRKQANIVYATIQSLVPHIYAKNPEVGCRPSEHVNPDTSSYAQAETFADTLEIIINRTFDDADLKEVAKLALRETMICKVAVVKVGYQVDFFEDPVIASRVQDMQEQLAAVQAVAAKVGEDDSLDEEEVEARMEQTEGAIKALMEQLEQVSAEGLVIDPVMIDDFRIDPDLDTLARYRSAKWMAHKVYRTDDEILKQYDVTDTEVKKFHKYKRTADGIPERMGDDVAREEEQVNRNDYQQELNCVWELWERISNTVYTWAEGGDNWLREPHQPKRMGARWYPFFVLGLNWLDMSREFPSSETELLENLGEEYNTIRQQAYEHRKLSKPHYVGDKSRIGDASDIESFSNATLGEISLVNAAGQPIRDVFAPAEHPPFNANIYDTTNTRTDIEWMSGVGDAQRGGVLRAKTATEANIQQMGLGSRVDEKRDAVEDWLSEIAKFSAELLIQNMSLDRARRIAGPEAFWPMVDKETLYTMVEVEIRAGSTGKPDKQREQEVWMQMYPLIMENVQVIMQMRAEGIPDKENPYVQVLTETFKRLDERIAIEKFLPGEPVAEDPQSMSPMAGQIGPQGDTPEEARMAQQGNGATAAGDPAMDAAAAEQQMMNEQMMAEQQAQMGQIQQEVAMMELQAKRDELQLKQVENQLRLQELQLKLEQGQIKIAEGTQKLQQGQQSMQHAERSQRLKEEQGEQAMEHAERTADLKEKQSRQQTDQST